MVRDAIAQLPDTVPDEQQVEAPQHGPVLVDEHVVRPDARLLVGEQGVVPLGEVLEVLVAAVGDARREEGAIRRLESQDRRGMMGAYALQLGHLTRLSIPRTTT